MAAGDRSVASRPSDPVSESLSLGPGVDPDTVHQTSYPPQDYGGRTFYKLSAPRPSHSTPT